jgi:drug/metabolite transporter (DMT)-like permease
MGLMGPKQAEEFVGGRQAPLRFGVAALILGNMLLPFGPMFVRMADTGPVAAAFWRVTLAVPFLFLIAKASGDPARRLPKPLFWLFAASGIFFAADLAAWHIGIFSTKLANANLLGNATSFLLPLWAFAVARQWPTRTQGAAMLIAAMGAGLLLGRSYEMSQDNLVGDLLCVLAGVFYTAFLLLMARAKDSLGPWPTLAWSTLMTVLPLFAMALLLGEVMVPTNWTPLLALALCSQILGQGLMIYAIGRVAPLLFGLTLLLQPMVGAAIGWSVYGEALTTLDWIGACLIGLALLLVRQPEK